MASPAFAAAQIAHQFPLTPEQRAALENRIAEELTATRRLLALDAPTRLARAVLDELLEHPEYGTKPSNSIALRLHQTALADNIGLTRSYVSTLINGWKERRIIRSIGRNSYVENLAALRKVAGN